jgi:DNA invertase Pin-like site-specific DNA recombinase
MKKAVLYGRSSTPEQHLESQFILLRGIAAERGLELTGVYSDFGVSSKARRPGIDSLLIDARCGKFSVILIASFDRLATSIRNFWELMEEIDSLGIVLISAKEAVDTSTPTGRTFVMALGSISQLQKSITNERIKAGMRRRKLDGLPVGRSPLVVDHDALVCDRLRGMSLTDVARKYSVSRASVVRFVRDAQQRGPAVVARFPPETQQLAACAA